MQNHSRIHKYENTFSDSHTKDAVVGRDTKKLRTN
jgi:hypothetical protein